MIRNTTQQNLLIKELYAENVKTHSDVFKTACILDTQLEEEYDECCEVVQLLNHSLLQPSDKSLEQILRYSRTYLNIQ